MTGPGEPAHLAVGGFSHQLVQIVTGAREPVLVVGDLTTARDYLDVRDAARGLFVAATEGHQEVYNVCSGVAVEMSEIVSKLIAAAGLTDAVMTRARAGGRDPIRRQCGNPSRLQVLTGWHPRHDLSVTLREVFEESRLQCQTAVSRNGH